MFCLSRESEGIMDQDLLKLKNIIADTLNVDPDEIEAATTFADDLGASDHLPADTHIGHLPVHMGRYAYQF